MKPGHGSVFQELLVVESEHPVPYPCTNCKSHVTPEDNRSSDAANQANHEGLYLLSMDMRVHHVCQLYHSDDIGAKECVTRSQYHTTTESGHEVCAMASIQ